MSKIAEDIKDMLKEKYQMDLWYMDRPLQDQEIDGVIVSEGGSRDSWGITIETQDDDNIDYTMDIGIRMKEVN
tara:strand:+ start:361 stop:579 length:219 start_codon:yes stop_codon:yes gene_type:complete